MVGFFIVNLLVPGDPEHFAIAGAQGDWELDREHDFPARKHAIENQNQCAETYVFEHPVELANGAAVVEAVFGELLPYCLAASFVTGRSVTASRSLPHSEILIIQGSDRLPRERSFRGPGACVNTEAEFKQVIEAFLAAYPAAGQTEKIRLIVHHWLDALSCWSLEDLYLSATTILQIIAATEETKQGNDLSFLNGVTGAANRFGMAPLSTDFRDMRNDLIHDGTLSGTRFVGKTASQCRAVATDVLNWIDRYLHAALGLGPVRRVRFDAHSFDGLNAYSL